MNERPFIDQRLARLADGELSPGEYRELLGKLDENPQLWRACALALLEAQALRGDLRAVRGAGQLQPPPPAPAAVPGTTQLAVVEGRRNWVGPSLWPTLLSIAASFLLALSLGLWWNGSPEQGTREKLATGEVPRGGAPSLPHSIANGNAASPQLATGSHEMRPAPGIPSNRVPEQLTVFVGDGTGQRQPVNLPVIAAETVDENQLWQSPAAIPPEVRQWLEHAGQRVRNTRRVVPLRLPDGRQVLVPVEQLEIVPAAGVLQ